MSKGVKKVVSVVAAIAIPFVAGPIASALNISTAIGSAIGSATAGSILGPALVGAGLGAAKGAVLGEDIGRNALFGGISGGLAGYFNAPTPTQTPAFAPARGGLLTTSQYSLAPPSQYSLAGAQPFGAGLSETVGFGPVDYGFSSPSLASGAGLGSVDYGFTAGYGAPEFGSVDYGFTSPSLASSAGTGLGSVDYNLTSPSLASGSRLGYVGSSSSMPTTFLGALKQVPSAIAEKFKDPKMLADLTLRAAGQLAGSALAGDGLTPEERMLLNAQTEELRRLQQTNQALFNQRLEQAMSLIGDAKYFDPEYFGLQSARRAQQAGAVAKRDAVRRLPGDARLAEARRYDLGIARNVGTAFDTGYNAGMQGRVSTRIAGLNALPTSYPTTFDYYTSLGNAYNRAAERRRQTQEGIGTLFGTLTGRSYSQKEEEEEKRKKGLA